MEVELRQPGGQKCRQALTFALLGSTLEWFDFVTFGVLAEYLARAFFQAGQDVALLGTFALFGVGFLLRPFGGLILGWIGDTKGRKPAFLWTIVTMAFGTFMIAVIPPYAAIGVAAPILLLVARLLQGFSAGGEWGVAVSFLAEWSPEHRRGFVGSFLSVSVALGSLLASAIAAILITTLPPEAMETWGWRVPFLLGGLLGIVGRWLRANAKETPIYKELMQKRLSEKRKALQPNFRRALLAFGFVIHWTVCFYTFLVFFPSYARMQAGLSSSEIAWSNTIGLMVVAVLNPVVGLLSDRYGRKPFLLASCGIIGLFIFPAFWLIIELKSFVGAICVQAVFCFAIALYSGPGPAVMAELFPTRLRARLSGFSYALAVSLFGGFAPFIATSLIKLSGNPCAPAVYAVAAAAISFLVVLRAPETAGTSLT
jgi:MHS family proline/betaine transporter-like MFS transporter